LRHTTAQGVQCGGEREATNSRGAEALRRATAWSRSGVVTSTRDRGWTVFLAAGSSTCGPDRAGRGLGRLSGRCGRAVARELDATSAKRHGGGRRPRSTAPLIFEAWWSTPAGSSAEDAGNVVAASFWWGRWFVPCRRR
jgi:hypothetical protein